MSDTNQSMAGLLKEPVLTPEKIEKLKGIGFEVSEWDHQTPIAFKSDWHNLNMRMWGIGGIDPDDPYLQFSYDLVQFMREHNIKSIARADDPNDPDKGKKGDVLCAYDYASGQLSWADIIYDVVGKEILGKEKLEDFPSDANVIREDYKETEASDKKFNYIT